FLTKSFIKVRDSSSQSAVEESLHCQTVIFEKKFTLKAPKCGFNSKSAPKERGRSKPHTNKAT
ncbi:hypothetical protein, partial [Thermococcus sp. Bubb.Bath]|uniref:hypothetical protein n=1 Tax=Thermococcus sp. Bubb.Bath TaxID=1638242 RepID=UPI00198118C6